MNEQQELIDSIPRAVHLDTLAERWDTTPAAIQQHILTHHNSTCEKPIQIKNRRIRECNLETLTDSYVPK